MGKKIIFLLAFLLLFNVSAQLIGETQTNVNTLEGLLIDYPKFDIIKQDQPFNVSIRVFNISNGIEIKNAGCNLQIINHTGEIVLDNDLVYKNTGYNLFLSSGNFSSSDIYSFNIYCNQTDLGGFASGVFEVSYNGSELKQSQSILYIPLFSFLIFVFLIILFGIDKLPARNQRDEQGKILSITYLKYFRDVLWFVEWMILVAILYLSSSIAFAYLTEQLFAKILFALFRITFSVTPIIITVWVIWMFVNLYHDRQLQNMLNRGIFPEEKNNGRHK